MLPVFALQIMKTLLLYTSQTGFTMKYAQWIADYDISDKKCMEPIVAYLRGMIGEAKKILS